MCKKIIFVISLLMLLSISVIAEFNVTYQVTEDSRVHVGPNETIVKTNFGSETKMGILDIGESNYVNWIKFSNVYLVNATYGWLTCKVNAVSGKAFLFHTVNTTSELSNFNNWDEGSIIGTNQPCYQMTCINGTCGTNTSETPCYDANVNIDDTDNIIGGGNNEMTGSESWDSLAFNFGNTSNWYNQNYTGDITFFMKHRFTSGTMWIWTKESGNGCNLTIETMELPATTLDLQIDVFRADNLTESVLNASVFIENQDSPYNSDTIYTNSTGTSLFYNIPIGEYDVTVSHSQFATEYETVFLLVEDRNETIYLTPIQMTVSFNSTIYDKETNGVIPSARLEFIECQGGDTPFLDCALNYPNGMYISVATRYTNSSGQFIGEIYEMPTCFLIGFRKDGYLIPQPDVFVNSLAMCLDESWYSTESTSYIVPYFDYYMFPDVTNVTVTYTVRDGDTYARLQNANISIDYPNGVIYSALTDSNGEADFADGNGCWDLTISRLPYHTQLKTECFYDDGFYNRTLYLLLNESDSDSNITNYNITGFVFSGNDVLPSVDMYLDCEIFCPAGYKLYDFHDITNTNSTGQYRFNLIRENAECDIRAIENGYSKGVEHIVLFGNTEVNFSLTYLGKEIDLTGTITDCNSLESLVARVEIWHCGNTTEYDASLPCDYLIAQITNADGEYEFVNIQEGYIQFVITEEYHEEISQTILAQTDTITDFCLYEGQARYWLRGMVQNASIASDGEIFYQPIEAQVKVYNKDTNALIEQSTTNWISGYFAFELRKETYIIVAEAQGISESATIYLDHNYGQEELILTIGSPSIQEIQTEEFFGVLRTILPSVIIIFIMLMLVNAVRNTFK